MKALLLSAGLGTRLRPITNTIPKCLVPIAGKPLMDYWLDLLLNNGIDRVLINTHYFAEIVSEHVEQSSWCNRIDLVHEEELIGTGGTVSRNADYFEQEVFFVAHADNLTWFDLPKFIKSHQNFVTNHNVAMSMMTFETDAPETCGIVEENEDGIVIGFHEKVKNPPGNKANGAIYIFEPEMASFIKNIQQDFIDLSIDVLPHFMGRIGAFHNTDYLRDIGSIESFEKAECYVQSRKK